MDAHDSSEIPRRANIGCGWDHRDGYLNIDRHEWHNPDLVADARDLRALPSGHFTEVLLIDVLEHVERADASTVLGECARLMADGGRLVVRVPDVLGIAVLLSAARSKEKQATLMQCLFGTQAYDGDYHLNGFTELSLRATLAEHGFAVESLSHRDGWLFDCIAVRDDAAIGRPLPRRMRYMSLVGARARGVVAGVRRRVGRSRWGRSSSGDETRA